jgi:hypothetical protein
MVEFVYVPGNLSVSNIATVGQSLIVGTSGALSFSGTDLVSHSSIVPYSSNLTLGTIENPWNSIYVNTGTVFIGPTGAIQINSNGLVSSLGGFAAPYLQVGDVNPGAGILLFEQNNLLFYSNQTGQTGPVSVFSSNPTNANDVFYSLTGNVGFGVTGPQAKVDVRGDIKSSHTVLADSFTGSTMSTNKLIFDGVGSIYFQTGSATGCFITGLNYDQSGATHYIYYNSVTNELAQSSPSYFYSYSTGTQTLNTGSNSVTSYFQPVTFNHDPIMYHTFQHATGSSVFTGTFLSKQTLQFTYSLQIHSTSNSSQSAAAVLYYNNQPIAGSYRSCTVTNTAGEYCLTNTFLVNVSSGSHKFELEVAVTNTNVQVGGTSNIAPPTNSYTSANLCCTRVN